MKSKHTLDSAIRSLSKKGVLFVDGKTRKLNLNFVKIDKDGNSRITKENVNLTGQLIVVNNARELGNGSWGKIDYLCKKHDYQIYGLKVLQRINLMT